MPKTDITPFVFEDHPVRVVTRDGEPWFVAKDVCRILGIVRTDSALRGLDEGEKGTHSMSTLGGVQEMAIVSESGYYALTLRSRKAMTPGTIQHRFRRWVTSEVIPSIRKTGGYGEIAPKPGTVVVSETELRLLQTLEGANRRLLETQARLFNELQDKQIHEARTCIARNLILRTPMTDAEIARESDLPSEYVTYLRKAHPGPAADDAGN